MTTPEDLRIRRPALPGPGPDASSSRARESVRPVRSGTVTISRPLQTMTYAVIPGPASGRAGRCSRMVSGGTSFRKGVGPESAVPSSR